MVKGFEAVLTVSGGINDFFGGLPGKIGFDNHGNGNPFQLDKDLLVKGNKVYNESTCVFLPKEINSVLTKSTASRGDYLIGVCWSKNT